MSELASESATQRLREAPAERQRGRAMSTPDVRRSREHALWRIARIAVTVALALFVLALAASPAHAADPQPNAPDAEIAVTEAPAAPEQDEADTEGEGEPADPPPSEPDPDADGEGAEADPQASEPDTGAPAAEVAVGGVAASVGECTGDITRVEIRGTITGTPGTQVTYRWVRSDGAVDGAPQTITLPVSGTATVTTTWDRGEGTAWQALQVTSPAEITSQRAEFTVTCEREQPVRITDVVASAGDCVDGTGRIEFRATITGAPGTQVTYHWLRSDGAVDGAPQTITLPASGTATVTTTWDRGEGSGWQALQITGPGELTSERAEFTLACERERPVRITDVVAWAGRCVDGTGRVEFRATITGPAGTPVTYRWLRSDGAVDTDPQTTTLPASGTATVTTTWDRGEGSGWQALQITSPAELTSQRAEFVLIACDRRPDVDIDTHVDTHIDTHVDIDNSLRVHNGWKIPAGAPQTGGGVPQDGPAGLPFAALAAVAAAAILAGRVRVEER
jgi:hypothetical protein